MSLRAFEFAETEQGHLYELARGFVVVSEVPSYYHACQVAAVRDPLIQYKAAHRGRIHLILGTMDCKLLIPDWDSERHPDLAIYLTQPKWPKDRTVWRRWIPELVVEVVSLSSTERDYVQKREEYWALGVKEYWIVDGALKQVTVLRRRRTQWAQTSLQRGDVLETKLLPGFRLACSDIFDAAGEEEAD